MLSAQANLFSSHFHYEALLFLLLLLLLQVFSRFQHILTLKPPSSSSVPPSLSLTGNLLPCTSPSSFLSHSPPSPLIAFLSAGRINRVIYLQTIQPGMMMIILTLSMMTVCVCVVKPDPLAAWVRLIWTLTWDGLNLIPSHQQQGGPVSILDCGWMFYFFYHSFSFQLVPVRKEI